MGYLDDGATEDELVEIMLVDDVTTEDYNINACS